jgi:hypothetical protein
MDNLCVHKGEQVRELVEYAGCKLLYLPPYSPDLNSFEEAFSKVKSLLRQAERLGTGKRWQRRWVKRSMRSRPKRQNVSRQNVSLITAGTAIRINNPDPCCMLSIWSCVPRKPQGDEVPKVPEARLAPFWHFWYPVG